MAASESSVAGKAASILVLDGGLGTTLEDVFHQNIPTPLWSAKPVEDDPEVIIAAHLAFLRAGADVILTSTYQCAYNNFERSGYSREDARQIMLKSVKLAMEAKRRYLDEQEKDSTPVSHPRFVKIALSLGPYGATLSPAQEFDGFYPPPYGPDLSMTAEKTNVFPDTEEGRAQERLAIEALTEFHYERLKVFASDPDTWDALDFVAFETVPLRREIHAIRRAVARLQNEKGLEPCLMSGEHKATHMKPWWISTVHPDGQYPERGTGGGRTRMEEVAEAALLSEVDEPANEAKPFGFGINCTDVEVLPTLLQAAQHVAARASELNESSRHWLVLYPNRGDAYDPATQTWRQSSREGVHWAKQLRVVLSGADQSGAWGGIIAGGCCKTGPDEIARLRQEIDDS